MEQAPKKEEPRSQRSEQNNSKPEYTERPSKPEYTERPSSPPPLSFPTNNMGVARSTGFSNSSSSNNTSSTTTTTTSTSRVPRPVPPSQLKAQKQPEFRQRVVSLKADAQDALKTRNRLQEYEKIEAAPAPPQKKLPTPVKKPPGNVSKFAQSGSVSTNTATTTTSSAPYIPVKTKVTTTSTSTSSSGSPKKWADPIIVSTQPKLADVNKISPKFDKSGISKPNSPPSVSPSKSNDINHVITKFKKKFISK